MSGINNMGGICKGCTERTLTCHDSCQKFLDAKSKYDAVKKKKADEESARYHKWANVPNYKKIRPNRKAWHHSEQ